MERLKTDEEISKERKEFVRRLMEAKPPVITTKKMTKGQVTKLSEMGYK